MITCEQCLKREQEIDTAKLHGFRASELFGVTAFSHEYQGHRLYYSSQGVITLCMARRLDQHKFYQ